MLGHTLLMPSSASKNFWRQPWKMYDARTWCRYRCRRIRLRMVVGYAANTCEHTTHFQAALSFRGAGHRNRASMDPRMAVVATRRRHLLVACLLVIEV